MNSRVSPFRISASWQSTALAFSLGTATLCTLLLPNPCFGQKPGYQQKIVPNTLYGWKAVASNQGPTGYTEGISEFLHAAYTEWEDFLGTIVPSLDWDYAEDSRSYFSFVGPSAYKRWHHDEFGESQFNWAWYIPRKYVTDQINGGLPRESEIETEKDEASFPRPKLFSFARLRPFIFFESTTGGTNGLTGSVSIVAGPPFDWSYSRMNQSPPIGPYESEFPPMKVVRAEEADVQAPAPRTGQPESLPGARFSLFPTADLTIHGTEDGDEGFGFFQIERFMSPVILMLKPSTESNSGALNHEIDLFGRPHLGDGKNQFLYTDHPVIDYLPMW